MSRPRHRLRLAAALAFVLAALSGCESGPGDAAGGSTAPRPRLGVLSSLPIIWPLGADVAAIAAGRAETPWQAQAIGQDYALEPLDTLAPIPGLSPGDLPTDPLAGLQRLAVIQPRGLSPQDNVALDAWVRGGGHLLLVLDPMLTGDYDLPLTDPRHPPGSAIIPPVVKRWGMEIGFAIYETEEAAHRTEVLPGAVPVPLAWPGDITLLPEAERSCVRPGVSIAVCRVGQGRVTLIADAALFELPQLAGEGGAALRAVMRAAVE